MKFIIADSKGWFKFKPNLNAPFKIKFIKKKNDLSEENIRKFSPSFLFLFIGIGKFLKNIHKKYQCILFHTAPLPYGRGGSPIQNLIINGFKNAPVCAIRMIEELDAGPIYSKINISLKNH